MKGSIRFDNEINVEVAVDPSQDEGAKLLSAVNLVDGQELGSGGGSNIPTHNIKIEAYDTGADELVNYTFLEIGYFTTDIRNNNEGGFNYYYSYTAPESHIYKAPIIGDKIWLQDVRNLLGVGDGENAWIADPNADLIRSVSGSAVKDNPDSVIITGDCTITINVIPD